MEGLAIRLKSIKIERLKNILNSTIEFENEKSKCVTGIYGPNGSGKTIIIDLIAIFKILAFGRAIEIPYYFIRKGEDSATLLYEFKYKEYKLKYEAIFSIDKNNYTQSAIFSNERLQVYLNDKLNYSLRVNRNEESVKDAIGFSILGKDTNLKCFDFEKLVSAYSVCKNNSTSFIFAGFVGAIKDEKLLAFMNKLIFDFNYYARCKMTVIQIKESYGIAVRDMIPIHLDYTYKQSEEIVHRYGIITINLLTENLVPEASIPQLKQVIEQCNKVLYCLLDKMSIIMRIDDMISYDKDGRACHRIMFNSLKNGIEIPLIYESEGIKKIISMASALIAVYNNENALVAIDELDAGIFEILLGDIVKVLEERGKGQFIFTSHNLRVLEVVDPKSITISTMSDIDKFKKFPYVKPTNNFRNLYLRALVLDADKKYYSSIDDMEIALALRSAGKLVDK